MYLAERILNSKAALEGERKQVTVLFADLKGSMELLADRDPEDARQLLDPVLERMMEAVHRYEGTVNQVMGDGIMALFGAPVAHEDHAVRACYAALDMQAAIARHAADVRRTQTVELQIRVGLNSGEVVVRTIGSDLRMDYTAVGQTTHLAARMEQIADPGSILLTANTLRLAEGYVEVKRLGPVAVKGLDKPIEVYEAVGASQLRSRLHAAAARGLVRFIGRDKELAALSQALAEAASGLGQVVAIIGEAGVGKSRLVWEFTQSHRAHGWLVLEGPAVSYGKATPWLPVIELLKRYFRIEERDDARKIREKVVGKLFALDETLRNTLPGFLALLDVPVDDPQWNAFDPPQRRQLTLDALKQLFLRESQVQPLLMVFEDLHSIDTETQALLDSLTESLPTARLLVLVNYRPEYSHAWSSKACYTQLRLDPLPPARAQALLQVLLGAHASLEPLKRLLSERTQGNPFFIEESVRTLAETGVLAGEYGAYRAVKEIEMRHVPATVQAMLAARIDRLQPDDKRLLQAAAVIGHDVPWTILRAIADEPEDALCPALARLQATEFLYESSPVPGLAYTFKHALTYDVAYGSLLQERRHSLHARITVAIEQLYADRLAEHIERLAHHALRGEIWDKALFYQRQAGQKAIARSAYREAVTWYEQALGALGRLPRTPDLQEQAIDLRFELRNALLALGEHERILEYLKEAELLAEALQDRRRTAWTLVYQTTCLWSAGDQERATVSGHRALAIAQELRDRPLEVASNIGLGWAYHALGRYDRAIGFLQSTIATVPGELAVQRFGLAGLPSVVARTWLAWCMNVRGEFAEGLAVADEGLRIARTADHPFSLAIAHFGLGMSHLERGEYADAIAVLEGGLEICRSFNNRTWLTALASALGYGYALSGHGEQGLPLLQEAIEGAASTGVRFRQSQRVAWLSKALLLEGRSSEAVPLAQEALALAEKHGERGYEAEALRLLGEIAAYASPAGTANAEPFYQRALKLASELKMRPLVAQCHFGLGQGSLQSKSMRPAGEHLRTAASLFREMGMHHWQERAQTALMQAA